MAESIPAAEMSPRMPSAQLLRRVQARLSDLPLVFLILALAVGTFLVFAQPPGQGLDEAAHFDRIWTLTDGTLVAPIHHGEPGGSIPKCVVDYLTHFSAEASKEGPFSYGQY